MAGVAVVVVVVDRLWWWWVRCGGGGGSAMVVMEGWLRRWMRWLRVVVGYGGAVDIESRCFDGGSSVILMEKYTAFIFQFQTLTSFVF
ncbi:hypothetical protein Hanom_Chr02g00171881 [Helianthus anomalus]